MKRTTTSPAAGEKTGRAAAGAAAASNGTDAVAVKPTGGTGEAGEDLRADGDLVPVTCGKIAGQYVISEKKVLYQGRKMAPAKFEEASELKSRRWKRTIKVHAEVGERPVMIGEFLDVLGIDTAAGVENPKHKKR